MGSLAVDMHVFIVKFFVDVCAKVWKHDSRAARMLLEKLTYIIHLPFKEHTQQRETKDCRIFKKISHAHKTSLAQTNVMVCHETLQ